MKVMITGHRPPRLRGREKEVSAWIEEQLRELNPGECINGMAMWTDQIFANKAKEMGFPLMNVYPFKRKFHPLEEYLNENATIVYARQNYSKQAYYERDCMMVDMADIVLAVWDGKEVGGTWLTIDYARKQGKEIRIFNV